MSQFEVVMATASATSSKRTLTLRSSDIANSQAVAKLKNFLPKNSEIFLASDDMNNLCNDIMQNIIATEITEPDYIEKG